MLAVLMLFFLFLSFFFWNAFHEKYQSSHSISKHTSNQQLVWGRQWAIDGLAEYPYLIVWCKQYWVNVIGWFTECFFFCFLFFFPGIDCLEDNICAAIKVLVMAEKHQGVLTLRRATVPNGEHKERESLRKIRIW